MCSITFDELEIFITEPECNLKVLRVITFSEDEHHLDADRWKDSIVTYIFYNSVLICNMFFSLYSNEVHDRIRQQVII